jgi:CheY-like chemotaxis protein
MPRSPDRRRPDGPPVQPRASAGCTGSLAAQMGVLIATAAALYFAPLEQLVGRRHLVELVHVYTGFTLPLPLLRRLGPIGRAAAGHPADEPVHPDDWAWLRSGAPLGRDPGGQVQRRPEAQRRVHRRARSSSCSVPACSCTSPTCRRWPGVPGPPSCTTGSRSAWASSSSDTSGSPPRTRMPGWACGRERSRSAGRAASTGNGPHRAGSTRSAQGAGQCSTDPMSSTDPRLPPVTTDPMSTTEPTRPHPRRRRRPHRGRGRAGVPARFGHGGEPRGRRDRGARGGRELQPDLVILDLMLPGIDGLEVCRRLRAARLTCR